MRQWRAATIAAVGVVLIQVPASWAGKQKALPVEEAALTYAPEVPPPVARKTPAIVRVHLDSGMSVGELSTGVKYAFWDFNGHVPGPFIRTRVGDAL